MEMTLTTPAMLFPAISLLLLAYTNRFLALASLIRTLYDRYKAKPEQKIQAQIDNLRYRVGLIRNMQAFGISSLFLCILCMFVLFIGLIDIGQSLFAISLLLLLVSLGISLREIQVSGRALRFQLEDLEEELQ
ncbi:MAG: DUF2721 domain-containing protein [Candidatus Marinimicrobia bacterium]|nr:DUF2721 domain-containing protein [Candidatus Neomarinimicrobiota bacterium]